MTAHQPMPSTFADDDVQGAHDLLKSIRTAGILVEAELDEILPRAEGLHARVQQAMRYAVFAGGKRLRPFLVLRSAELFCAQPKQALRVAAAIELMHTYSLVHDDLPAMDNDDLRRGKPTVHRAFDEATAILAGDALLTLAFEVLADPRTSPLAEVRCGLVTGLAQAAGSGGMIGGQMIDMQATGQALSADNIALLQAMKTGALFNFACVSGAILAQAGLEDRKRMYDYARDFGLVFQITDDLLDVVGSAEAAGKAVGKDNAQGKATLVTYYGVEGARDYARALARRAAETLAPYEERAEGLAGLPMLLLNRDS